MSDSLVWELVRNNNAFLVKRGHTKRAGAVQFSSEKGNVLGVNSFKYSGIANSKTVDVTHITEDNKDKIVITAKAHGNSKYPKKATTTGKLTIVKTAGGKFTAAIDAAVSKETAGSYYRKDLTSALKAKYQNVTRGIRVKQGRTKGGKSSTGRK